MADQFGGSGAGPRWFNPTISTGNLITLVAGAAVIYAMSIRAEERIAAQGEQIRGIREDRAEEIRDLKSEVKAIDALTRSNSIAISTGLRDMGERLVRIETLLRQVVHPPQQRE